jgi:hypothetical protein
MNKICKLLTLAREGERDEGRRMVRITLTSVLSHRARMK